MAKFHDIPVYAMLECAECGSRLKADLPLENERLISSAFQARERLLGELERRAREEGWLVCRIPVTNEYGTQVEDLFGVCPSCAPAALARVLHDLRKGGLR
jgi:hypothetical protein